ncbi:porin family protein [Flavobacterium sp.]|uniref:porin family protein n=1 Tax=Flavobacterium sp. TaxID=239 RepID=UPI002B4AAE35|nr:porin family protein [Flavobacterium sp.]HLP64469.1 porin family protein [Flavobacterium sp.]
MKSVIYTFFLIVVAQNFVLAQDEFRMGVFGGLNYSTHRDTNAILDNTDDSFTHFTGGFSVEYKINEKFSLKTGLGFEKKRIDYFAKTYYTYVLESGELILQDVDVTTKNEYKYLTIPLVVKYSFGAKKSFFANFGPYVSLLTNHDKRTTYHNLVTGNSNSRPESEFNFPFNFAFSSKEYGVSFGFGKSFAIKNKNKISIELRNNLGLNNRIANLSSRGLSGDIKTNTINLITEFSFGL